MFYARGITYKVVRRTRRRRKSKQTPPNRRPRCRRNPLFVSLLREYDNNTIRVTCSPLRSFSLTLRAGRIGFPSVRPSTSSSATRRNPICDRICLTKRADGGPGANATTAATAPEMFFYFCPRLPTTRSAIRHQPNTLLRVSLLGSSYWAWPIGSDEFFCDQLP